MGRPRIDLESRQLIRRMQTGNVTWGAPRIHGELLKLGYEICETTVSNYTKRVRKPPSQRRSAFLANHHEAIAAVDFFTAVVEQRMEAVALGARDAKRLGVEAGSPALETVRRYRDAAGDDVLVSHSLHAAGRFSYTIVMERDR